MTTVAELLSYLASYLNLSERNKEKFLKFMQQDFSRMTIVTLNDTMLLMRVGQNQIVLRKSSEGQYELTASGSIFNMTQEELDEQLSSVKSKMNVFAERQKIVPNTLRNRLKNKKYILKEKNEDTRTVKMRFKIPRRA